MPWINLNRGLLLLIVTLVAPSVHSPNSYQHVTDECDWVDSQATDTPERSIRPVYLRCSQGRIEWKYPRGALRVLLRMGTSGKDFRGCVRAGLRFQGARLYLEGHRTLHLLFSSQDGRHPQLPRCFSSRDGQAALYVEAEKPNGTLGVAEFSYDLEARWPPTLTKGQARLAHDPVEADCRPCDEADLLQLYCTSDFVVRGRMLRLNDNPPLERTELKVGASKVYKQNSAVFVKSKQKKKCASQSHHRHHHGGIQTHDNGVDGATIVPDELPGASPGGGSWLGVVHFPLRCSVKFGAGEFLFLGRFLLGCPVVTCAPRWETWTRVWTRAASQGTLPCNIP